MLRVFRTLSSVSLGGREGGGGEGGGGEEGEEGDGEEEGEGAEEGEDGEGKGGETSPLTYTKEVIWHQTTVPNTEELVMTKIPVSQCNQSRIHDNIRRHLTLSLVDGSPTA